MKNSKIASSTKYFRIIAALLLVAVCLLAAQSARAATERSGSVGIQGTIPTAPPSRGATITVPGNGAVVSTIPVTVSGLCPNGLLVKVFSNNIFVGSTNCAGGSYTLQADLFSGQNDLVARVYDALDQPGPDSNTVRVTFNDAQFLQFGTHVTLSSVFAQRGAAPNTELSWPILIEGGTGPYAVSVDWGDGSAPDLISVARTGELTIKHTYKSPGVYKIIVQASDKNGGKAFLQLVGQATGAVQSQAKTGEDNVIIKKEILWWPALQTLPLILAAFWLGSRHQTYTRRKQAEKAYAAARAEQKNA